MLATQIGISWAAKPCQLPQVLTKSLLCHISPCHSCVTYSPRTSAGEASTANPSAHRSCSGIARHKGCQPVRIDLHMAKRNSGYRTRRSEEHTSELQSPYDLVCRLLLEKK